MVRVNLLPIRDILRKRELKQFLLLTAVIVASTFGLMVCTAVFLFLEDIDLGKRQDCP